MRRFTWLAFIGIGVLLLVLACAPKSAPAPAPTPVAPQAAPVKPATIAPTLSPEDAAWQKVVEAAKKEGKLSVYSYTWVGDTGLNIARAFKAKYGIEPEIVTGRGAEFLERIKTERRVRQMTADLTEGSPLHILNMKKEGITTSLGDLAELKNVDNFVVSPNRLDPEKNVLVFRLSYYTAWVNTRLVKEADEPQRWVDLLEPKWKGKMIIGDPQITGSQYQAFTPLIRVGAMNLEFIKALGRQDLAMVTSDVDTGRALSRGDYMVSPTSTNTSCNRFVTEGAPIKPVFLEEGTTGIGGSVAAIKDGPHPNATKLFASWLFSAEGQEVVSKAQELPVIRKGVPDYSPPGTQLKPKKLVLQTEEDNETAVQMFRDKVFPKLWGK